MTYIVSPLYLYNMSYGTSKRAREYDTGTNTGSETTHSFTQATQTSCISCLAELPQSVPLLSHRTW